MSLRRKILLMVTAAALAAVLILPTTGWLARLQVRLLTAPGSLVKSWPVDSTKTPQQAAKAPNDYAVQLAATLVQPGNGEDRHRWETVRALAEQFPDEPAAHAQVLRYATFSILKLAREDNEMSWIPTNIPEQQRQLDEQQAQLREGNGVLFNRPDDLAAFLEHAAAGERLDPTNGFFPMMTAYALYAERRDAEAFSALERAAETPRWDDLSVVEVRGRWRLAQMQQGETGALPRLTIAASTLLPHYAQIRDMARLVTSKAMQAERQGRTEEGYRLRRALTHAGAVMATEAQSFIGNLVGIAITAIGGAQPGGVPSKLIKRPGEDANAYAAQRQSLYVAYLKKIGHSDEAAYFQDRMASFTVVKQEMRGALDRSIMGGTPVYRLLAYWGIGLLLLANVVWMLLFGGAAALLGRVKALQNNESLPAPIRNGILLGLILPPVLFCLPPALGALLLSDGFALPVLVAAATAVILLLFWQAVRQPKGLVRLLAAIAGTVAVVAAFIGTGWLLMRGVWGATSIGRELLELPGYAENTATNLLLLGIIGVISAAVPLLLTTVLLVLSRFAKIPAAAGTVRGLRQLTMPVVCLLLIGWSALIVVTARAEARGRAELEESMRHEGRYYARLAGNSWPEAK